MYVSVATVADDERTRRRLGDATRSRIDDLASGWSIDAPSPPPPQVEAKATPAPDPAPERVDSPVDTVDDDHPPAGMQVPPPVRKRPRTLPPPPPGSEARKALEEAIVEASEARPAGAPTRPDRERLLATIPASASQALASKKSPTRPPPIPARALTGAQPELSNPDRTPPVIIEAALIEEHPSIAAELASADPRALSKATQHMTGPVPIGEFDSGPHSLGDEKLRIAQLAQATELHHTADALLGIPAQPATVIKEVPISVLLDETAARIRIETTGKSGTHDPQTAKFERGDPTHEANARDDATEIQAPTDRRHHTGGTLRAAAMLRRKRGIWGDVRYVFTAAFGLRAAKKETDDLEGRQKLRQTSRRRHLVTLGRTAVTADALDHPALGKTREALQSVEDERSKHAGAVAAADAELERVRRDRAEKAKVFAAENIKTAQEIAELAKKLEPLEKEATGVRKRGGELREQLRQIAKKIAETEQLLTSIKSEKLDRNGIQADIASLKADQKAIQRDEPAIAAEMDALQPRIASIIAARTDAETKQTDRQTSEAEDQRRTTELFEAIGAKRKVVERAMAEAETARDTVLFDLGERLYVDRPAILSAQLAPIEQIDLEYGESDRRLMELKEIQSNVDRWKLVRGTAMILVIVAVVGAFTAWLLYMLL